MPRGDLDYDAVVVGSGFGGSVVAHRLAEADWKVCVLERGRWHRPGDFPRTPAELKRSFWDPSHGLHGMFDVWSFRGLAAVVASGMGGGSLIYANVLAQPPKGWMRGPDDGPWPIPERELAPHFKAVRDLLKPVPYPARQPPFDQTPKTAAFRRAARRAALTEHQPDLAIQFADDRRRYGTRLPFGNPRDNHYGVQRLTCELAGECDVGCNVGAKHSLDLTVLSAVEHHERATVRELAEVRAFRPIEGGFEVELFDHSHAPANRREAWRQDRVTCRRLVLAAGTLGTALLLLRSRLRLPGLSQAVGRHFSANGDYLAFAADCDPDPSTGRFVDASQGPVITSSARGDDSADGGDGPGFHLQDGGFPGWAAWIGQVGGIRRDVALVAAGARAMLDGPRRGSPAENLSFALSKLVDDGGERLLPILSLGRDKPDGRLHLRDGRVDIDWRKDAAAALYERTEAAARLVAEGLGGRYVDPLRLLRPITVHPLGGCALSRDSHSGVVDLYGCVHNIPGLSIADGSVLPGPVGINPALTIAALADRHAEFLVDKGSASSS